MHQQFSRAATSLALVASLWTGSIATVAAQTQQQNQAQTTASKQKQSSKQQPATNGSSSLPVNEDPNMIGKRNINKGIIAKMSGGIDKEVALGRQLAAEVDKEAKFIDDPVITEYINRVGQNIVLHSDAKVPFTIKVVDSDEVNAFALPGGFFYVNKGLILAADNEAEVAGVMAHEIAHVAARHALENQTKANAMQIAAIAGTILTGGILGEVIYDTAGFWLPLGMLKFSRGAEAEADRLGVQYMYAAGYDPNAMSTMFEKLLAKNKKKPGTISKMFASHPATTDRIQSARALVARFPEREEYVMNSSEFQRVKAHLLRLSNAKATTAGPLADADSGGNGRPTLKRRQPTPDDNDSSTTTTDSGSSSTSQKPASTSQPPDPPKLKRRSDNSNAPQSQPTSTP